MIYYSFVINVPNYIIKEIIVIIVNKYKIFIYYFLRFMDHMMMRHVGYNVIHVKNG